MSDKDDFWTNYEKKIDEAFRAKFIHQFVPADYEGEKIKCQISIHEGWHPLLKRLCQEIDDFFGYDMGGSMNGFQWVQIKEKFGTLRAYFNVDPLQGRGMEMLCSIIDKYETESGHTCEICGEQGKKVNARGYITTRCKKHFDELVAERKERFGDDDILDEDDYDLKPEENAEW
jgi:hypothetical protein